MRRYIPRIFWKISILAILTTAGAEGLGSTSPLAPPVHPVLTGQSPGALAPLDSQASAAGDTQVQCDSDPDCGEAVQKALSQSNAEQYESALKIYQAVYERWPTPWILINLGRVQQKMKNPEQAVVTFQRYLDIAPDDKLERLRVARAFLVQAKQEIEVKRYKQMLTKPLYKKWWFWTLIGGGVATAAITAGAIGGTRNPLPAERMPAASHLAFQF